MKVVLGDPETELTWGLLRRWAEASGVGDEVPVIAMVPGLLGTRIKNRPVSLNDLNFESGGGDDGSEPGSLMLIFTGKVLLCRGGAGC